MERHGYKNGYGAYECRSLDSFMWRGYLDLPSTGHLFWWLTRTLSIGTKKRIKLWIVECCLQQLWYSRLWNNRNRKLSIWGKKVSCQLLNFLNLAVYKHNYLQSEENSTRIESQNFSSHQGTYYWLWSTSTWQHSNAWKRTYCRCQASFSILKSKELWTTILWKGRLLRNSE